MVFHAFVKYNYNHNWYRYVVVAPTADDIDEWWREITESRVAGFGIAATIFSQKRLNHLDCTDTRPGTTWERIRPDFYVTDSKWIIDATKEADKKIIVQQLPDGGETGQARIIPGLNNILAEQRTDHRSGRCYYIRSTHDRRVYWSVTDTQNGGSVWAGPGRTRFRIKINGKDDETVIINKDQISITSAVNPKLQLGVEAGELYLGSHGCGLFFGDFKKSFLAEGEFSYVNSSAKVLKVDGPIGEEWELVP